MGIEDTEEVKAAKAEFATAFAAAEAGEHAALATAPVATAYLADLPEVAEAKDAFRVVFDKYAAGEVALPVAPVHDVAPVVAAYLADLPEVTEAKAAHKKVFDAYTAGEIPLPVAPVHEVKPVVAAPVAIAAPVAAPYWPGAFPYAHTAYAGHYGYPYAHAAYAGYAGYYGAYPYALPTVAVAPAKAE